MATLSFCPFCGNKLTSASQFCNSCGKQLSGEGASPKSALAALLLCIFVGCLGIHRFYVGKIGTGILMLLTLGGFGIWNLVDTILIACNEFKDKQGHRLIFPSCPSTGKKVAIIIAAILASTLIYASSILALAIYATSGLVTVAHDQLSALREGDFQKAYSYTSKDFRNVVSMSDFEKFVNSYPSLKNNKDAHFTSREFKNSEGYLEGTLESSDGATTPVKYQLVKEDNEWKILSLTVNPTGVGTEIKSSFESASNGMQLFSNKNYAFTIERPKDWKITEPEKGTVIFSKQFNEDNHLANVNIQTMVTTKSGGRFSDINSVVSDLKTQIAKIPSSKILEEGSIDLPKDPKNYSGKYMIVAYTYEGKSIKQLQYVFSTKDGRLLLSWAYTAMEKDYDTYLPLAKAMFNSWVIY